MDRLLISEAYFSCLGGWVGGGWERATVTAFTRDFFLTLHRGGVEREQ